MVTTTASPKTAPMSVPGPVARRTNMAMKKSPNKGAVRRLTTLNATSRRLPWTIPTPELSRTTTTPTSTEMYLASLTWSVSTCCRFGLRNRSKKSTVITEQEEFMPEERLDMAAANSPATTRPLRPMGMPNAMKRGKRVSASLRIVWPSGTRCGLARK